MGISRKILAIFALFFIAGLIQASIPGHVLSCDGTVLAQAADGEPEEQPAEPADPPAEPEGEPETPSSDPDEPEEIPETYGDDDSDGFPPAVPIED